MARSNWIRASEPPSHGDPDGRLPGLTYVSAISRNGFSNFPCLLILVLNNFSGHEVTLLLKIIQDTLQLYPQIYPILQAQTYLGSQSGSWLIT